MISSGFLFFYLVGSYCIFNDSGNSLPAIVWQAGIPNEPGRKEQGIDVDIECAGNSLERILRIPLIIFNAAYRGMFQRRIACIGQFALRPTSLITQSEYVHARRLSDFVVLDAFFNLFDHWCSLRNTKRKHNSGYHTTPNIICCIKSNIFRTVLQDI